MDDLKFDIAQSQDAKNINTLVNSVYRGDSSKAGWTTEADLLGGQRIDVDHIKELISTPNNFIIIANKLGHLLGCVHLEKKESLCYLGMLSVDSQQQGAGTGKRLMVYSEDFAKNKLYCTKMEMTVIGQRKELIEFYKRRGYEVSGETREFPKLDPRFGLPKRDDLYFEVLVKTL